jgi:hypothetical protein
MILMKLEYFGYIFENPSNIEFMKISCGSWVVPCRQPKVH